ncbi:MAG: hypothetical protein Q7U00_01380 [Sulfurimonas sp.]|nr:hypothetical protein [Sulfurimonas sp.]
MSIKTVQYKDYYYSTRKSDYELYFSFDIKYDVTDFTMSGKNCRSLDISLKIEYLFLIDNKGKLHKDGKSFNEWLLTCQLDNNCSFDSSIMINSQYRSYGVGTLAINKILLLAQKYIPNHKLQGKLSPVDAGKDNFERRYKLYKNLGFHVTENSFYVEKLSTLKIEHNINGIEKIDAVKTLYDLFENKQQLQFEVSFLKNDKQRIFTHLDKLEKSLLVYKKLMLLSVLTILYILLS